jgi:hypothetical protein
MLKRLHYQVYQLFDLFLPHYELRFYEKDRYWHKIEQKRIIFTV